MNERASVYDFRCLRLCINRFPILLTTEMMALCGGNVGPLCGGEKGLTLFNDFLFTFCTNDDDGDDDTTESSETLKF